MKRFLSVLLAVMMVFSTVSFAAPSLAGVTETAVEVPAVEEVVAEEEAATLATDISEDTSTYGTLLWNLDFEDDTYPDSSTGLISECGPVAGYTSAENEYLLPEEFTGFYRIQAPKDTTVLADYDTTMNGTNVFEVGCAPTTYPYFAISSFVSQSDWTSAGFPNGYYTFVADVAMGASNTGKQFMSRIGNSGGKTTGTSLALTTEMVTYTHYMTISDGTNSGQKVTSITGGNVHDDLSAITSIGSYFGSSANSDIFYVDNYKVYWRPLTVDVTVDGGENQWAEELVLNDVANDGSVTASDLIADLVNLDGSKVATGIVYNGITYALTDAVAFDDDATVTVLWENVDYNWYSDEYGALLFKSDFDSAALGSIDLTTTDTLKQTAFAATSEISPKFSQYSSVEGTLLLGTTNVSAAEIVADETLGSNVLKITANGSYPQINYTTPYNQRNKCDISNYSTGVLTIVHKYKTDTGLNPTYRYNGWKNDGATWTGNGSDDSQDAQVSTDLGNGYTEWVATYNLIEDYNIDQLKIHLNGNNTGGYAYFDDICVYVKPQTVTLTIDNSQANIDNITISDYATTGMSVAELVAQIPSTYGYVLKGLSKTPNGDLLSGTVAASANTVLYTVWEKMDTSEWESENGQLVMEINFDSLTAGSSYTDKTLVSNMGRVNPAFPTSANSVLVNAGGYTATIKERATGNNYLEYTGASGYAAWKVITNQQAGFTTETGSLVATFDVFNTSGNSITKTHTVRFTAYGQYAEDTPEEIYSQNQGTWEEYKVIYDEDTIGTSDHDTKISDITEVGELKLHGNGVATTDVFGIDNIRIYYLPETTTLTIKNTTNDLVEEVQRITVSSTVALSDLTQYVKAGKAKYDLVGWSYEDGGELIEGDTLTLGYPTTIYPVWAEYNYAVAFEFNEEQASVNDLKANTSFAWSSYGNNVTSDTNQWGTTVNGTIYGNIKWTGGYNTFTMKAPDSHTGVDGTRWSYGTQDVGDGKLQDQNITAGTVKEIHTRVRYRNVPDFSSCSGDGVGTDAMSHTVDNDGDGTADGTFYLTDTVLLELNCQFVGNYWSGALQAKGNIVEGEWVEAIIDVSNNSAFNAHTIYGIFMDPTPFMWNGMIMEVDYVRLVSTTPGEIIVPEQPTPEYAPTTDTEKASIRIDAPSGIRFKATITSDINTAATDYGWVVARQVKLTDVETELVVGGANTIVGYGRQDGTDLKSFFEETDEVKTFTAVVYNLPAGYETDVLVSKPFVKVDGTYYYGETVAKSIYEVACAIRDGGYEGLSTYQITKIDAIIAAVDA